MDRILVCTGEGKLINLKIRLDFVHKRLISTICQLSNYSEFGLMVL
jgi:hypothetical protein